MKTNRFVIFLFVLLVSVVNLPAQQTETNRNDGWHPSANDQKIQPAPSGNTTNASAIDTSNAPTFEETKAKAEKGDAEAQASLGSFYAQGLGVPQDYAEAVKWYRKAAKQGHAHAQCNLGMCYDQGQGVPQDYTEAVKWYHKAAEQGDTAAQINLGNCYYYGHGVAQDYTEVVKWYRKAAEQDDADAQAFLGWCYDKGQGVSKDYTEAVKWFRKAAEQGVADAQSRLGFCYAKGQGVPQDYAEAVKWCRRAADQGLPYAEGLLGGMYDAGKGVPQDYVEAYKWSNLAAAQGFETAATNRDEIASRMTPEQIAEAQELSREFRPRKESASNFTPPRPDEIIATQTEPTATGTGFFITDDGYLISNYHVVKDATKVRLLTGAGLIDAKVVQVDAANDLALLKADGRFAALPIAASRTVASGRHGGDGRFSRHRFAGVRAQAGQGGNRVAVRRGG